MRKTPKNLAWRLSSMTALISLMAAPTVACRPQASAEPRSAEQPANTAVAVTGALTATGAAGPFERVTVTIVPAGDATAPRFSAVANVGDGKQVSLGAPDEPADFFIVEAREIVFAPIDGSGANAVIILYDSSQIGPGHGTDQLALVYRLEESGAVRMNDVEARLEGADSAAAVRQRLAAPAR